MNNLSGEIKLHFLNNNTYSLHLENGDIHGSQGLAAVAKKDNVEEFFTALSILKDIPYVTNNIDLVGVLQQLFSDDQIQKLYSQPTDIISMQALPFNSAKSFGGCYISTEDRGSIGYITGDMSVIEKFCKETHDMEEAVRIAKKWQAAGYVVTSMAQREEIENDRNFIIRGNIKKMHFIGTFAMRHHG